MLSPAAAAAASETPKAPARPEAPAKLPTTPLPSPAADDEVEARLIPAEFAAEAIKLPNNPEAGRDPGETP